MNWNPNLVKNRMPSIHRRYPEANIYWSAGDQMAFEVVDFFKSRSDAIPVIGGFDWLPESLNKVAKGEMAATTGGHFLVVAQALIRLVDYHNGIDRFGSKGTLFDYEVITRDNVELYRQFLSDKRWRGMDYSPFLFHKNDQRLDLTVENLVRLHRPQTN